MSVINRVLRDLDKAGEVPGAPVAASPPAARFRLHLHHPAILSIGLLGLALAAWGLWPVKVEQADPVGTASAPPPAPAPAVDLPPPVMAQPQLQPQPASRPTPPPAPPSDPVEPAAVSVPPAMPAEPTAAPPRSAPAPASGPAPAPEARVVKEAPPQNPVEDAWREVGQLLERGQAREARARLADLLKLAPGHAAARQTLITLLIEAGDRAAAMPLLVEGRALYPSDPWYPRSQAQLHLQAGQPALAAASLKPALSGGSAAEDWALYAGIAAKLGQHDEAAHAWRAALRSKPDQGAWWIGLGVALERLGQKAEAAQAYQRALQTRLSPELKEFAEMRAAGG